MHIEEQLPAAVFRNDLALIGSERVYEMPVPVVEVDSDVFPPVRQTVLDVEVRGSEVSWYYDGCTLYRV